MCPHAKTVVTDSEGEKVGRLIGGFKAVLLQRHGAATSGVSLEEAMMNTLQWEDQARMNYYALSAMGHDYPSLPQALLHEIQNRSSMSDLPHSPEPFARAEGQPRVGGVWQYLTAQVSQGL